MAPGAVAQVRPYTPCKRFWAPPISKSGLHLRSMFLGHCMMCWDCQCNHISYNHMKKIVCVLLPSVAIVAYRLNREIGSCATTLQIMFWLTSRIQGSIWLEKRCTLRCFSCVSLIFLFDLHKVHPMMSKYVQCTSHAKAFCMMLMLK